MSDDQDHHALAEAVRARREELGLSQRAASEKSKRYDTEVYPDKGGKYPGISVTAWAHVEQAKPVNRRPHTLCLVDAVLRWPEGTARAIAEGRERPVGAPVQLPSENNGQGEDDAASRAEVARALRDVADLRVEVRELAVLVNELRRLVEGGR